MKKVKKILLAILTITMVFLVFILWYRHEYSMDIAEEYEANTPLENSRLLIATQGSEFKNGITEVIVDYYKTKSIYIKVIDISSLLDVDPVNYNALLVVHTWENWKPPMAVKLFMDRTIDYRAKMVVMTTSGEGSYKMEGIDAITGESILDKTPMFVDKIIEKLNPLLKLERPRSGF